MNWKTILLIATSLLFLFGCGNTNSPNNTTTTLISSSEIQHLQIIQDNGYFHETERYIDYNYSLSELSSEVLQKIDEISTTTENLYCSNDGVTYEVNITDSSGEISTYVSNNRDCGRENEIKFISVDDFEDIIVSISGTENDNSYVN